MQRVVALIAVTATISELSANGSPHTFAFRRRAVPEIEGYTFGGCYTEASSGRALTGSAFFDDYMTVEKCATACTGFKYFGLEYGRECFCGNNLNTGSVETELTDCSFSCPGDSTQNCGAGNRLDIYIRTVEPVVPTEYFYHGCYVEPTNDRALTGLRESSGDMTVAKCAGICGQAGFSQFGLEYYTECYCGNYLSPDSERGAEEDCNFPCGGNSAEVCGGDWRLNVYKFESGSSTSTTTPSLPTPTPGANIYSSEGCYTDSTVSRTISGTTFFDDAMTIEKCATVCASYTWFGLEYGRECYCGNSIKDTSQPTAASECSFACPGNPSQKCGAGDRLNVYRYNTLSISTSSSTSSLSTTSESLPTTSFSSEAPSSTTSTDTQSTTSSESVSTTTSEATSSTATSLSVSLSPTTPIAESTTSPTSASATSKTSSPITTSIESTTLPATSSPTTTPASSISTTSTTTTTTTSFPAPTPVNVINNGNFEDAGGWTVKYPNFDATTYNFANTDSPHGGLQAGSIIYNSNGGTYQTWFNQRITLIQGKRYNFSGWVRASVVNPGCSISFFIGNQLGVTMSILSTTSTTLLSPTWLQVTGFYDAPSSVYPYTFNVKMACSSSSSFRTYFMDDLVLAADS